MKKKHQVKVRVSDHAVLRYLERVGGWAVEELRQSISSRVTAAYAEGATGVVIDGFSYRIGVDPVTSEPIVATVIQSAGITSIAYPKDTK